jgi:uncharacterized damage-inducible protein DinB
MPQRALWVERGFPFDLPVFMFPNVLERLRGTPARVTERLHGVPPELLTWRPDTSWTVLETIGHLIQVEGLWMRRLDDYDAGLAALQPADMTNRRTEDAHYNQAQVADLLAAFRDVRGRFVRRLEVLDDAGATRSAHHPRLNRPMRVLDMMVFAAEHDDHHLVRITQLLRGAGGELP